MSGSSPCSSGRQNHSVVFLDRDGTIIKDKHYLRDPENIEFYDGVFSSLQRLRQSGYQLIVVTNQSGVARGLMTEKDVRAVHDRLEERLSEKKIELLDIYYAPYHPEADDPRYLKGKEYRKPRPGMLKQAGEDHGIDFSTSFMIGDKLSDIQAGKRAGCRTVLVRTGKGRKAVQSEQEIPADYVASDFSKAVEWIFSN